MKAFNKIIFLLVLILSLTVAGAFWHQNEMINRGELIVLYPVSGGLKRGPVYVVKADRRIVDKSSVFSVVLWESQNGIVYSRRDMIAIMAYIVANIPASAEEELLFRQYFPKITI